MSDNLPEVTQEQPKSPQKSLIFFLLFLFFLTLFGVKNIYAQGSFQCNPGPVKFEIPECYYVCCEGSNCYPCHYDSNQEKWVSGLSYKGGEESFPMCYVNQAIKEFSGPLGQREDLVLGERITPIKTVTNFIWSIVAPVRKIITQGLVEKLALAVFQRD